MLLLWKVLLQEINKKKSHQHTHKTYSRTQKTKTGKGILKFTFIPTGIVLLSIVWLDPLVPLSEYCVDVVTMFPEYTKKNRA